MVGPPAAGGVTYEFVVDLKQPKLQVKENQESLAPHVIRTPLPRYPENALAAQAAPATVVVRFVVEPDGTVGQVLDSPLERSTSGPFAEEFRNEVESTLREWLFTPGAIRTFEDGADLDGDGTRDYRVLKESQPLRVYYDIRFHFAIVEGVGQVRVRERDGDN